MKLSERGIAFLQDEELCRLKAYWDLASPEHPRAGTLTIGWGHTGTAVYEGMVIDQATADELFIQDLRVPEQMIRAAIRVPLMQSMYDALMSFVYNRGAGNFLRCRMRGLLNGGEYQAAAQAFTDDENCKRKGHVRLGLRA